MSVARENFKVQALITTLAIVLFSIKLVAYFLTKSLSVLTDALESIVNIAAGLIGLYSIYVASKPSDEEHPYGHGKIEFISAGVEGTLITLAGLFVIFQAFTHLAQPQPVLKVDLGIILIGITGVINYFAGIRSIITGEKNHSLQLVAAGKHLKSDTYTSIGIFVGLILIYFTGWTWLDPLVAFIFSGIIIYTGYKIVRTSIAGIMDEADKKILASLVQILKNNRTENWIDIHNFRIIKYGSTLHCDCHLSVPWYLNVNEAHREIELLTTLIREKFGKSVEFFIHSDPCKEFSCQICTKQNCLVRQHSFIKRIEWTVNNIASNTRHRILGGY